MTIADAIGYDAVPSTCSTNLAGCHQGQTRSWAAGGGAPHPVGANWLLPSGTVDTSHVLSSLNDNTSCSGCHITGGTDPTCNSCHNPGGPNMVLDTCDSCHASPPDSVAAVGNNRPNREGAHTEHNALPKVVNICATCHNGAGTDTLFHYDTLEPADVVFLNTYDAKTGTAGYDPAGDTCSKVSCHGGQTSPIWLTGSLDVNTQCESCHELGTAAQTPEYNSYYSGRHSTHVSRADCSVCHDVGKLATDHFIGLNTPVFEGDPALTIADAIGYDAGASTCSTNLAGCHQGQTRSWEAGGGAPHPVGNSWLLPSGTVDTSHVLASLNDNTSCSGCHITGGTDPTCDSCHNPDGPNMALGTCDSCHASPPDSVAAVGNSRPNREGGHTEHNALPKVVGICATCHDGAGTNTLIHYDSMELADVEFLSTYNAKTGFADYVPSVDNCSNVSCHGGQTTPNWITGSLDVNTQCASCHEPAPTQYNGYTNPDDKSHNFHIVNESRDCTECHNISTLATNHFTNLDTQIMEGPASATIGGIGTLIPAGNYVPGSSSCNPACHGQETW